MVEGGVSSGTEWKKTETYGSKGAGRKSGEKKSEQEGAEAGEEGSQMSGMAGR